MQNEELVLCYRRSDMSFTLNLNEIQNRELRDGVPDLMAMLDNAKPWFVPRSEAEVSEEFVQLIPYAVIAPSPGIFLVYERGSKGGESRLHAKMSLGFGGHINLNDAMISSVGGIDVATTVMDNAVRELMEETGFPRAKDVDILSTFNMRIAGAVYTEESEVSKVHLAVVLDVTPIGAFAEHVRKLVRGELQGEAGHIANPRLMSSDELAPPIIDGIYDCAGAPPESNWARLEDWSKAVVLDLLPMDQGLAFVDEDDESEDD